jgi:hypothetical protein
VKTDVRGWFAIGGIMPETEILLVYRKDGFMSGLRPVVAPRWSSELSNSPLLPRDKLLALQEKANLVLRAAGRPELEVSNEALDSNGQILFLAPPEVHVELDPSSGEQPLFILANGEFVPEVPVGETAVAGIYLVAEPRDDGYELVYQHPHGECRRVSNAWGGWPSASGRPNATRVPARAGYMTWATSEECKSADAGTATDAGQR